MEDRIRLSYFYGKEADQFSFYKIPKLLFTEEYFKKISVEAKVLYGLMLDRMSLSMKNQWMDVVLFGLELYRYEFSALLMHAEHLEAAYGVGPHAISVPRIKKADDIDPSAFDNGIDDDTFAKIVACIRIATPYTGMIISTRESEECRARLLHLGISQMSGGSKTSVGGYFNPMPENEDSAQFDISDKRPLDEVIKWLMDLGYLPSFCTACYRKGRTGDRFMEICKQQQIKNFCHPNAILTLKEYLQDYASDATKQIGNKLIAKEVETLDNENIKNTVNEDLEKIEHGERDFRF